MINHILLLGAGSAGLLTALTLKVRLPSLRVQVVRSTEIGTIGVGEGTTMVFPKMLFEYLRLPIAQFYQEVQPMWKLGLRFLWGSRPDFFYTFSPEYQHLPVELGRSIGFYHTDGVRTVGATSALMAEDKVFTRRPDGLPQLHRYHAFHMENAKLVAYLEARCCEAGVEIIEGRMARAERGPAGIAALHLEDGRRLEADLYVDASGFRSELLGRALAEPWVPYDGALFCDRAVIGGWARTDEPIQPYTTAETMDHGWCWQIEHEHWINRGYVYASRFVSDDTALAEFLRKNPKVSNQPRVVRFRSGRSARNWVENVVGVGNAVGFVEPLEATALQVLCVEASTLADSLADCEREPTPSLIDFYNRYNGQDWDEIRDFLAVHYRFNTRLDTPFWRTCRGETDLGNAADIVRFYRENGPSFLVAPALLRPNNSFGMEGYITMLAGQQVPHGKPHRATAVQAAAWQSREAGFTAQARGAMGVKEALEALRRAGYPGL